MNEKKTNFLFGSKCVTADFNVGSMYVNFATNPGTLQKERWDELLQKFPVFKAYGDRFVQAN